MRYSDYSVTVNRKGWVVRRVRRLHVEENLSAAVAAEDPAFRWGGENEGRAVTAETVVEEGLADVSWYLVLAALVELALAVLTSLLAHVTSEWVCLVVIVQFSVAVDGMQSETQHCIKV